jgi:hypothetical protein
MSTRLARVCVLASLMGCTSSVNHNTINNYAYSTTMQAGSNTPPVEHKAEVKTITKWTVKTPKHVTLVLCQTVPPLKPPVLPPLVDYSKLTFRSHNEAMRAMASHIAELRKILRNYNDETYTSNGCKPYKVLLE